MPITSLVEIRKTASAIGLKIIEGTYYKQDLKKITVDILDLDNFFELAKELGSKFILLDTYVFDEEILATWQIDEEEIKESEDDPALQKKVIKAVRQYNQSVMNTPVGVPAHFCLTIFVNGITYEYSETEHWFDIPEPSKALDAIYEELDDYSKIETTRQEKIKRINLYPYWVRRTQESYEPLICEISDQLEPLHITKVAEINGLVVHKGRIAENILRYKTNKNTYLRESEEKDYFFYVRINESLYEYFDMIKTLGLKCIFMDVHEYTKVEKDYLKINLDNDKDTYYTATDKVKADVADYNESIEQLPSHEPYRIDLFVLYGAQVYVYSMAASWFHHIESPANQLATIKNRYNDEIEEGKAQLRIALENELMKDEEFKGCTTKDARKHFVMHFLGERRIAPTLSSDISGWADYVWSKCKPKKTSKSKKDV